MTDYVVTDIYGRTPALESLCSDLSQASPDLQILDPYEGIHHDFDTQGQAYAYFMNQVGLEKYQAILARQVLPPGKDTILIGFSVGASAIWGISGQAPWRMLKKAFCFYGSRIRHSIGIVPLFDMELIFPEHEPHFDVDELMGCLEKKPGVTCTKAKAPHGFMNALSPGFDPAGYAYFTDYLATALARLHGSDT